MRAIPQGPGHGELHLLLGSWRIDLPVEPGAIDRDRLPPLKQDLFRLNQPHPSTSSSFDRLILRQAQDEALFFVLTLRQAHPSTGSPFDRLTLRQAQGEVLFFVLILSLSKDEDARPMQF